MELVSLALIVSPGEKSAKRFTLGTFLLGTYRKSRGTNSHQFPAIPINSRYATVAFGESCSRTRLMVASYTRRMIMFIYWANDHIHILG